MLRANLHFEHTGQNNKGDNYLKVKHKIKRGSNTETLGVKRNCKMHLVYTRQETSYTGPPNLKGLLKLVMENASEIKGTENINVICCPVQ